MRQEKRRRRIQAVAALAAGLLLAAGSASGQIANSAHDFSSQGSGGIWGSQDIDQTCIFCHTPHAAQANVAPLWNRVATNTVYTPYSSPTLNATPSGAPTGDSALCLSCHDGSIAVDQFAVGGPAQPRLPAIGGVYYPGSPFGQGGPNLGGSFAGNARADLSNDHPISFVYNAALAAADGELVPPANLPAALHLSAGGRVECSTCHDVHATGTAPGTALLRITNSGSQLCFACHIK